MTGRLAGYIQVSEIITGLKKSCQTRPRADRANVRECWKCKMSASCRKFFSPYNFCFPFRAPYTRLFLPKVPKEACVDHYFKFEKTFGKRTGE